MSSVNSLFSSECKFLAGATTLSQIPVLRLPEVAFVGRSNVGKSSLVNSLTGKNTARVSKTPGRTQQINFFSLGDKISLVDLPGYGYAAVSKQMRTQWDDLILGYLRHRKNLRRIFLLIDSKLGIKENDAEIMEIFDSLGLIYQVILTKSDKKSVNTESSLIQTLQFHPAAFPQIISTSSRKGEGIKQLRSEIFQIIRQ